MSSLHKKLGAVLASGVMMVSGSVSGAVLSSGLVGYYTFDASDTSDSSSLVGGSSSNNLGAWSGSANYGGGFLGAGHAIVGDGAGSNFLTVTGSEYNFGTGSFSVLLWLNLPSNTSGSPNDPSFASSGGKDWSLNGGTQGWNMAIQGDDYDGNISDGVTRTDPARIDIDPGVNNWALMALVVDQNADQVSMYALDFNVTTIGDDASAPTTSPIGPTGNLTINGDIVFGQDGDGAGYSLQASGIDDVSLWNRALTTAEIQEIYTAGRAGNDLSTVLTAIPEPSSLSLFGISGLMILMKRRRQ
ncbi:LamG-like jellyroll fold domain-containing protein [Rubritalea tangerina]|uniref:LamG-like jellyroll fold domain-containing protein n=2 Tax=Rubritalea tangerina TaxID=430798 RepID=A0ABW4ZE49_9BACT